MTIFHDGPAQGQMLMLRRAPRFLRIVVGPGNKFDGLDQLDDQPAANEQILAYEIEGEPTYVHISARGGNGGNFRGGHYRLIQPQPADSDMRETAAWQAWCLKRAEAFPLTNPSTE